MRKLYIGIILILATCILSSCETISNTLFFKDNSKEFLQSIIAEDYNKSIEYITIDRYEASGISRDSTRVQLSAFRKTLIEYMGSDIDYTFLKYYKRYSTVESQNTPKGTTEVEIQISNDTHFGTVYFLYEDSSHKIMKVDIKDIQIPIPSLWGIIALGILGICVVALNIYTIVKIKRSTLSRKWLKYIAVIFLNFPCIFYSLSTGFSFKWIHLQLMGFGFSINGYAYTAFAAALPIGGIYWLWRLNKRKRMIEEEQATEEVEVQP